MKTISFLKRMTAKDTVAGYLLMSCAGLSLLLANLSGTSGWSGFWQRTLANHSIADWINDGLMAVFFLLVGLELKQELMFGQLKDKRQSLLPVMAALGGMLIPALFYISTTYGTGLEHGFGIPMSTDIAFVITLLALLGPRVPASLKIFLTALAVIDDIGAVVVIAIFYTSTISAFYIFATVMLFAFLLWLNWYVQVRKLSVYLVIGIFLWFCVLQSGIHASVSGILLALTIPILDGAPSSPARRLQHRLHVPVYFLILPLFVLANTAITITGMKGGGLLSQLHVVGICTGLILGKGIGITLGAVFSVGFGWSVLPADLRWRHIIGGALLGGIGFTMAIFIATLAFDSAQLVDSAKIAILASSCVAAIAGSLVLTIKPK